TGKSGIIVIDLDMKHGVNGVANWNAFLAEHGIELPETYAVVTPSGGYHLYFDNPDAVAIKTTTGENWGVPGVDIRAIGGLVVAPGSGGYHTHIGEDVADAPEALLAALPHIEPRKAQDVPEGAVFRDDAHVYQRLSELAQAIRDAPEGEGNTTVNDSA